MFHYLALFQFPPWKSLTRIQRRHVYRQFVRPLLMRSPRVFLKFCLMALVVLVLTYVLDAFNRPPLFSVGILLAACLSADFFDIVVLLRHKQEIGEYVARHRARIQAIANVPSYLAFLNTMHRFEVERRGLNVPDFAAVLTFLGCPLMAGALAAGHKAGWYTLLFVAGGAVVGWAFAYGVCRLGYRLLDAESRCLQSTRLSVWIVTVALLYSFVPFVMAASAMGLTSWLADVIARQLL